MPDHNRRFERVGFACQAKVMFDHHYFVALTEDLSLNGLSLRTDYQLSVGKRASLSLNIPSVTRGSPITIEGVVARKMEHALAFEFKSLDHETFSFLRTVIIRKSMYR